MAARSEARLGSDTHAGLPGAEVRAYVGGTMVRAILTAVVLLFLPIAHAWGWRTIVGSDAPSAGQVLVVADGAGDVVVAGTVDGGLTVVKLRGDDGRQVWRFQLPGPSAPDAMVLAGRDPVVAGRVANAGSSLIKLSSTTGDERWRSSMSGAFVSSLAADPVGDVVAGWRAATLQVVKHSGLDGRALWKAITPTSAGSSAAIAIDALGDVVVGASAIVKLDGPSGSEIWKQDHLGDRVRELFLDAAGDVIVGARFVRPVAQVLGGRLCKVSGRDGRILWKTGPGTDVRALAVRPAGQVVATRSRRRGLRHQPILLAFGRGPHRLRWKRAFPVSSRITGVATDASGDVVVVADGPGDFRFPSPSFVTKLRGTRGGRVWRQWFDTAPSAAIGVDSLALDPLGNVVVAGRAFTATVPDFRSLVVVKLRSDDGLE